MSLNAAQTLVGTLRLHGVTRVFCVPGESFLAALDALYDEPAIEVITCRHESGAGFMAVADAKLTKKAGVAFVSRGPGAANASIALHVADQDAAPFVLFIGQIERKDRGRGAFQEVDYAKSFGGLCKGVWQVDRGEELAGVCAEAFALAEAGIPGPVLVVLPEDMLFDAATAASAPRAAASTAAPADSDVKRAAQMLAQAQRPLMIVGSALAQADVQRAVRVSEAWGIPVVTGWKQQHLFPNRHAHYAGHMGYNIPAAHLDTLLPADLVLAVGTRLGDVTTQGYRLPLAPKPEQPLIHVHPARDALNRVHRAELAIAADCGAFLAALSAQAPKAQLTSADHKEWIARTHGYAEGIMQWKGPESAADGVVFGAVVAALNKLAPEDAILITDAGNFSTWVHRYFYFGGRHTLLAAVAGAMGIGVPAAVASAMRQPERRTICFVGDGGILMTGNEIATALMYGAKPLIILSENNSYATIRLHQEKHFPGRVKATGIANPDFVAWAKSFGAKAWLLDAPEKIQPVLTEALAADTAAVVVVKSSLKYISAFTTLKD